jgi:Tfp pilus assembly protein PilO
MFNYANNVAGIIRTVALMDIPAQLEKKSETSCMNIKYRPTGYK